MKVDIERLIYGDGSMFLHPYVFKKWDSVSFLLSLPLTLLVFNEFFTLLSQSSKVLLKLFISVLVLRCDLRCVSVDFDGSAGVSELFVVLSFLGLFVGEEFVDGSIDVGFAFYEEGDV